MFSGSKMKEHLSRSQSRTRTRTHSRKVAKVLSPPSVRAGTTTSMENARERTMDSSKSTVAKSTQMPSAQALSFWSMYSSIAAHISSKRYITVSDLACAVATILAIAVLILSLKVFVDTLDRGSAQHIVVSGRFGNVMGRIHKVVGHTNVYAFLSVPYAEEPVAELRFRRTRTKYGDGPASQDSLIYAMEVKAPCVQSVTNLFSSVSEDCLHLSIWTTSTQCNSRECAYRPVLVFLHGGAFQEGGNSHPLYDAKYALRATAPTE
ncbi:cholinesterase-like [Amblyomma americanum]